MVCTLSLPTPANYEDGFNDALENDSHELCFNFVYIGPRRYYLLRNAARGGSIACVPASRASKLRSV